ncbi:MAG: type II toxin-antitoxin system HicB family antitoxin [Anaerolineae bacterium]
MLLLVGVIGEVSGAQGMTTVEFTYWYDGDAFLGFLNDYPDYWTQGETKQELIENLKDLYRDITSGQIPFIRTVEELVIA